MLPRVHVAGGVRFDGTLPLNDDVEDYEVVFEHCVTRTLPPALTLEEGLQKFKDALEILKLSPPPSSTGFLRFQVYLPIHSSTSNLNRALLLPLLNWNLCFTNVELVGTNIQWNL